MYRLIYRLLITFGRNPTRAICVNLNLDGNNLLKSGARAKERIVDLRVGDRFLLDGQWQEVLALEVESERLLTDKQAAEHRASEEQRGWLVKARENYVSPLLAGGGRRPSTECPQSGRETEFRRQ